MVAMTKDEDVLEIPAFLRRDRNERRISGAMLDRVIAVLELAKDCLDDPSVLSAEERELFVVLGELSDLRGPREPAPEKPPAAVAEPIDPNEIRLDGKLKDRVGQQIVTAIDDGHNTFARLCKAIPVLHIPNLNGPSLDIEMPDRVLKSALGHVMRGKLHRVRVVKVSPKVYGVERR
jgi:hypothetical protein